MAVLKQRKNPLLQAPETERMDRMEYTVERTPANQQRAVMRKQEAREAVGEITHGLERYVLTGGQFSLIDVITATAQQTGPAHFWLSTWNAELTDITELGLLRDSGYLLSVRILTDRSFKRRRPHIFGQIEKTFGPENIATTRNHAKLALFRNMDWDVSILTSQNLNMNPRSEFLLVREDSGLAEFNQKWAESIFRNQRKL